MLDDILTIIKYFCFFIGSFYGFYKLAKIKFKLINLLDLLVAALFATGLYYATKQIKILMPFGLLLFTCLYTFIRYRNSFVNSVTMGIISCGITILSAGLAFLISTPLALLAFSYIANEAIRNCVTLFVTIVLLLLFNILIYQIKRFKNGISIQSNDGTVEILILTSILSIFLITLFYTAESTTNSLAEFIVLALIFCGLEIIVWLRKNITNRYQQELINRDKNKYETRIEEYATEHVELLKQNEELSKIIHRDNKLIPSMIIAVKELAATAENSESVKMLITQLEELAAEHKDLLENYQAKSNNLPSTEVISIDAIMHFLYNKAAKCNTAFDISVDKEAINAFTSILPEMNILSTVICDLGENAIIAAKSVENGKVLITFGLTDNMPYVSFYDNGELFDERVIANMGKIRITTHKEDGGNGIGLMTLFENMNKYGASFCLDEHSLEDYTKFVKITFDGQNKVTIITGRENVKKISMTRPEFIIEKISE